MRALYLVSWACALPACSDPGPLPPREAPPTPASVALTPSHLTFFALGEAHQFTATVRDQRGAILASTPVSWASSDPGIVSLSTSGMATAQAPGEAVVSVSAGTIMSSAAVMVTQRTTQLRVLPSTDTLAVGSARSFSAWLYDLRGNPIPRRPAWRMANGSIGQVDSDGAVAVSAPGRDWLIAHDGDVADTVEVGALGPSSLLAVASVAGQWDVGVARGDTLVIATTLHTGRISSDGDIGAVEFSVSYDATAFELLTAISLSVGSAALNTTIPGQVLGAIISSFPQGTPVIPLVLLTFHVKEAARVHGQYRFPIQFIGPPLSTTFLPHPIPIAVSGRVRIDR